jgi:hypothetical protein
LGDEVADLVVRCFQRCQTQVLLMGGHSGLSTKARTTLFLPHTWSEIP